jgi:hypothetical protein
MSRAHKILIIFGAVVLLAVIAVVVFRHQIASYALRTVIYKSSDGKVDLKILNTYFSPFEGTISLKGPDIYFTDAYLDEKKSMKLNRISLDEILINDISIIDVLFNRHIIAGKLIIKKPVIWFEEEEGGNEKSSFNPDKLMQSLNQEPSGISRLDISIKDIEIQYGTLNIDGDKVDKYAPSFVDFKLILHNFSTQPSADTSIKRILFSEDFLFKIKNLQRVFLSGYKLTIDSALFSSTSKSMNWSGVSLFEFNKDSLHRQGISLHAGSFTLNDIEIKQINSISNLHLRSLIISHGYLYKYGDKLITQNKSDTLNDKGVKELFSILHGFELDTLWLNQFNFAHVEGVTDTVFLAENISMIVKGIAIDSTMVDDPFRKIIANELSFRTGRFYAKKLIDSIDIGFTDIEYFSSEQKFQLNGLSIKDSNKVRGMDALQVSSGKIKLDNISVFKFREGVKQSIEFTIIEPDISYNMVSNGEGSKNEKKNSFVDLFDIEQFRIKNGNLSFSNDSLNFKINGLDFNASGIEFTDIGRIPIKYKSLALALNKLVIDINSIDESISTGRLSYQGKDFKISNIYTKFRTGGKKYESSILLSFIELKEFDLNKFLNRNELEVGEVLIDTPILNGNIQLFKKEDSTAEKKGNKAIFPFKIDVGKLNITNGNADCYVFTKSDSVYLKSVINLELANVNSNILDTLNLWLEKIGWNLNLSNTNVTTGRLKVSFKNLTLDEMNSRFSIEGFKLIHDKNLRTIEQPFEINDLSIPKMEISGLNFGQFIFHDTLNFNKIFIDKPTFDAIIHPHAKTENKKIDKPDLSFLDRVNYDTIELKNLKFNLENRGKDSSNAFYSLKDISVFHKPNYSSSRNVFSGLLFAFNDFSFTDTIANKYVTISRGQINPVNNSIIIAELNSGELDESNDFSKGINENSYRLSGIELSGIYLENKLPTQFTIEKLKVDSLALNFVGKGNNESSSEIEVNRNMLEKYNNIISKFKIDSTLLNNLKVNYLRKVDEEESSVNFENVALVLNKISLDTVTSSDNAFPLNDVTISLRGRTFITKDSLYSFKTGNVNYNFPLNRVTVDSVWFTPRYSDTNFFNKAVYQTDRMDLFAQKIELNNIRFQEYIKDKTIHVGSVDLFNINADMERNKAYPMKPGLFKDMPQASIRNASQIFTIDSVRVFDSYVSYTQHVEKSEIPGKIFFDRFNIHLYNISNDPRFVDSTSQLIVNADAFIMGQSRLDLSAYFNLLSPTDKFWFKANSEPIDLTCLNSMTENLMGMSIAEGKGFIEIPKIEGDSGTVQGKMYFKYKKLKITLYNRKKAQLQKGMFTPLVDFMLNGLLLKSNNPKWARSPRIGQAYFERDTQKGIVNYVFKSSLSGIISTLGFNNKDQRQEKKDSKDGEVPEENTDN